MWIKDRFGNLINSDALMSLYVEVDPGDTSHYIVAANNSVNTLVATFNNGSVMTEAEAQSLSDKLASMLGLFDPTV